MQAFYKKLTSSNQSPYLKALHVITAGTRSQINALASEFSWQSCDENRYPTQA
jgi:hypothetical protein